MNRVDVAIVGAGAAGIAAARRLTAAGRSVSLLEARDRAGGRAHTIRWQGQPIDTGAAWLHFAADNAFTGLAEEAGFTVIRRDPNWGASARIGGRVPTPAERERARQDLERYEALITAAAEAGRDVALSEVLPQDHYRQRFDSVMTWAVGAESREISTLDFARYEDSRQNWAVAEGLGSVVADVAKGLPVRFGACVQKITVREDSVRLETTTGTVEAGAVIVTVPTSVLAAGAIKFDPPLPPAFTTAFDALPLGIVNKVFFSLPPDAIPSAETTQLIGSDSSARTASYTLRPAGAPLISAFFGGDLSRELGAKHQLAEFAREELRRMLGSAVTDRITAAFETDWEGDPFARGSYSAARPGHADARGVIARPVRRRLCFAGESCSRAYYGTLHGAWLSGREAAEHVLAGF